MRSIARLLVVLIPLVAAACTATEARVAPTPDPQPTTTTVATPQPEERISIADAFVPGESALYDPSAHVDERPVPVSISIESIGVSNASVVDVGVEANGDMEVPGADAVGWYRFNPRPGEEGSAVLAAHIAYNGNPGVFRYLADVDVGAIVRIGLDNGASGTFQIVEVAQYDKQELPDDRIFAKTGDPVLTLITCGGSFNRSLRSYDDNVVAYAVPVLSPGVDGDR